MIVKSETLQFRPVEKEDFQDYFTGSTRNECNHFEAMCRAEFSIRFLSSYRKLKPKDEQIDW